MYTSPLKFDRNKSLSALKSHANYNPKGSTFDANHLQRMLFDSNKIESFMASKPRYESNVDMFQKVPYKLAKQQSARNSVALDPNLQDSLRPSHGFLTVHRDLQKQPIY